MSLSVAFRAFFAACFHSEKSAKIDSILASYKRRSGPKSNPNLPSTESNDSPSSETAPSDKKPKGGGGRSEALTLLSALQRDARLMDLVYESLDSYTDAQIGAAARDVLRDTKKVLDRMFAIQRLIPNEEGSAIDIPALASPGRWRVVGHASQQRGTLAHAGWVSTKLELPTWNGRLEDALVIAPAEVETT